MRVLGGGPVGSQAVYLERQQQWQAIGYLLKIELTELLHAIQTLQQGISMHI